MEYGVADDRIVHLWGGAGATDTADVLARNEFGDSRALTSAVDRTLAQAGISGSDVRILDAYSCFPVVPKLLGRALGLGADAVPTVLGGHSFFGGPLNSYTLHAVAEVTRLLRHGGPDDIALVHANGGYLTYQHTVLLSRRPHAAGYIGDPSPRTVSADAPDLAYDHEGDAVIVTATIEYDRNGLPEVGLVIAETPDGRRVAGHTGPDDAAALIGHTAGGTRSLVGAPVHVTDRGGLLAVSLREEAHP
jgi:acetyl-CoA C-acetyltransferase